MMKVVLAVRGLPEGRGWEPGGGGGGMGAGWGGVGEGREIQNHTQTTVPSLLHLCVARNTSAMRPV